jgi:serine/threonine-protein kinase
MANRAIQLQYAWTLGERLAGGGFGEVWTASSPDVEVPAVAKLVPKAPGAQRELLFVDLGAARNVVPVLDSGETDGEFVLVMERADKSLRQQLQERGKLSESDAVAILRDVVLALDDLDGRVGRVVHRDIKPENVLLLNETWCLADFGISRYAEATTAQDTHKFAMTPPYAAPEQWRFERTTNATDVYAFGVMAYEMLGGQRPFSGPDYREEHLHQDPPSMKDISGPLASLVYECLQKSPEARPSAGDIAARLANVGRAALSPGLASLQQANERAVVTRAKAQTRASVEQSESAKRAQLFEDAQRILELIAEELKSALTTVAPTITVRARPGGGWGRLVLDKATMWFSGASAQEGRPLAIPFVVVAFAEIGLEGSDSSRGYGGRSHSLWYCDAEEEGRFSWYELAFMQTLGGPAGLAPFSLPPDQGAAAIAPVMATVQLARNLRRLVPGQLDEFVELWGGLMAAAAQGPLIHPNSLPEDQIVHNWRGR